MKLLALIRCAAAAIALDRAHSSCPTPRVPRRGFTGGGAGCPGAGWGERRGAYSSVYQFPPRATWLAAFGSNGDAHRAALFSRDGENDEVKIVPNAERAAVTAVLMIAGRSVLHVGDGYSCSTTTNPIDVAIAKPFPLKDVTGALRARRYRRRKNSKRSSARSRWSLFSTRPPSWRPAHPKCPHSLLASRRERRYPF